MLPVAAAVATPGWRRLQLRVGRGCALLPASRSGHADAMALMEYKKQKMGRELGRPAHVVTTSSLLSLSMASGWRSKHRRGQQPGMPNIHGPSIDRIRDRRETETGDRACKRKPTASRKIADWRVYRRNASAATGRPATRPTGWMYKVAVRMRSNTTLAISK